MITVILAANITVVFLFAVVLAVELLQNVIHNQQHLSRLEFIIVTLTLYVNVWATLYNYNSMKQEQRIEAVEAVLLGREQ